MSQCQHLSVASRWNPERADIAAYSWDLDHIEHTNRWEILPVDRNGMGHAIRQPLKDCTGTVVFWQRLDRILGYKHPYGEAARRRLSQICRDIEQHLGMVFHQFLTGELRRSKRFKLLLNGNEIKPWDPYCRIETKTRTLSPITIPIEHEGISGEVFLEPYVLPHQDDFSSPDAFRAASGPASWNQQQGFYIYRSGRMIQSGGWSNLLALDEHMKLARIAVSFSPLLDEAFKINVAKMRVQLPSQIRDAVRDAVAPVRRIAREVYDRKPLRRQVPTPSPPPNPGVPPDRSMPPPIEPPHPMESSATAVPEPSLVLSLEEWAARLLAKATTSERPVVETVLGRLKNEFRG